MALQMSRRTSLLCILYRKVKQDIKLNDRQAKKKNKNKLDSYFNASLTAVNFIKYNWLSNKSIKQNPFLWRIIKYYLITPPVFSNATP